MTGQFVKDVEALSWIDADAIADVIYQFIGDVYIV